MNLQYRELTKRDGTKVQVDLAKIDDMSPHPVWATTLYLSDKTHLAVQESMEQVFDMIIGWLLDNPDHGMEPNKENMTVAGFAHASALAAGLA